LKLSPEKTKTTDLYTHTANFLGFKMGYYRNERKVVKLKTFRFSSFKRRSTGQSLLLGMDRTRVLDRLVIKGFINKKKTRGIKRNPWSVLEAQEIVQR
jgi:hypothetical protein